MSIYTSEKAHPYVYRLDNPVTGEIYIGYREVNTIPSHLDLQEYKTSSTYVEPRFEEFNWTIVAEFFLGDDAYDHEQLSIFEEWDNPLLMNKQHYYGKKRWRNKEPFSEESKLKMKITKANKTPEEKLAIEQKRSLSNANRTPEEKLLSKIKGAKSRSLRSEQTNLEIKQKIADSIHNRTEEEKLLSKIKGNKTRNLKTDEEKLLSKKKRSEGKLNKTPEEKAASKQKQADTRASNKLKINILSST